MLYSETFFIDPNKINTSSNEESFYADRFFNSAISMDTTIHYESYDIDVENKTTFPSDSEEDD